MQFQQVNLRWLLYAGLVLFVCKGLDLAAISNDDIIDPEAVEAFKEEAVAELENGFKPRGKLSFQETINKIQGNFADGESPNTVAFQALLEVTKNAAFDEMQISAKKIDWGKKMESMLKKAGEKVKEGGQKLLEKTKKGAKKLMSKMKNITMKCFNQSLNAVKELPEQMAKECGECMQQKIEAGLTKVAETVDLSKVPFADGNFKAAVEKCSTAESIVACIVDTVHQLVSVFGAQVNINGEQKNAMESILTDIQSCVNPEEMATDAANKAMNPFVKCMTDAGMKKLEKMAAEANKKDENDSSNSSESNESAENGEPKDEKKD